MSNAFKNVFYEVLNKTLLVWSEVIHVQNNESWFVQTVIQHVLLAAIASEIYLWDTSCTRTTPHQDNVPLPRQVLVQMSGSPGW